MEPELRLRLDGTKRRIAELTLDEAWLQVAAGRWEGAAASALQAWRQAARPTVPLRLLRDPLRESTLVTCTARLAQREWAKAETAARGTIDLFGADDETVLMLELAQWGRGTLVHLMARQIVSAPDGRPAAFDPAARARAALARRAATAGTVPEAEPGTALPRAEPFYLRGLAPQVPDESALRAELAAVTDESAAHAWLPHLRRAWLLIALRRHAEALDAVEAARREYFGARGVSAERHFAEPLFEDGCEAELVANIALDRWEAAADAGLRGLADHLGEQRNLPLVRIVQTARSTVTPEWDTWRAQFLVFDPVGYALTVLDRPGTGHRTRR
ncbi:hypothetical protein ACH4C2_15720 [Streptomyces sp. NPDC018057]|uniref:hypothetical protein n=1 Tax=unclassified Streptomyces TaxID=2593676 RepID=UPI0037AA6C08